MAFLFKFTLCIKCNPELMTKFELKACRLDFFTHPKLLLNFKELMDATKLINFKLFRLN